MKKPSWIWKETAEIIGVLGIIAGIVFLGFELRQNNDLMAAEARFNRMTMVVDAWKFRAVQEELYELRERWNNDEVLSRQEQARLDASVMAVLVLVDWTFRELSEDSPELNQSREVQRYNFANEPIYGKVWEDRKNAFDPAFVRWMEEKVIDR